ncbi:MAG: peptidoglycan DD-metalloendopeptidase family protein [Spongiibacteraceae bacterium]|jgi:murein DD-endopeptidase MepM/ murein hydrolase activator NlpD|nr:peptidoglycan DD-metalloendopeptidase family protein [Spongiibacteraceae bacterium]
MTTEHTPQRLKLPHLVRQLPRLHLALAGVAAATVFFALLLPSGQVQAKRHVLPLSLDLEPDAPLASSFDSLSPTPDLAMTEQALEEPTITWQELTVRSGDSLAKLFARAGVAPNELHEVLDSGPEAKTLKRLFPGQKLSFQINDNGRLQALRYEENLLNSTEYIRNANNFIAEKVIREPEVQQQFASGTIQSSLYQSAANSGLSDKVILELAEVFGGVVDFVLDLRKGDQFAVLYEEKYVDGRKVGDGAILAASFTNAGKTHAAYRYEFPNGDVGYFSPEGVSMRKAFMRAPLDFTRVSSGFNMKRFHPILKVTRPHRGVDYAAPTGTPVYAAGDGRVVQSGFTKPNGNYVVIQHGQQYQTKYLHLQKRAVRVGERVRQREVIGWVGSTGYATGPHLHYEFLVGGVHRNPATIINQLPKAVALAEQDRKRFREQTSGLQTQLASYLSQNGLAAAGNTGDSAKL